MRTGEDAIPNLRIPPSSEDLLVSSKLALKASGVYEIIRHFLPLLRLSPFTFEEMCAALQDEKQVIKVENIYIVYKICVSVYPPRVRLSNKTKRSLKCIV
jgi:hypothetical protein